MVRCKPLLDPDPAQLSWLNAVQSLDQRLRQRTEILDAVSPRANYDDPESRS